MLRPSKHSEPFFSNLLVTRSIEHAMRSDLPIPNTAGHSIEKEVPQSMALLLLYPKAWVYSRHEMERRFFQNLRIFQFNPFIIWNRHLSFIFSAKSILQR